MQIFELHFNPRLKEEQIFDSFVYEPENIYEKKLGGLYMVGEIQNALPENKKFLNNLARVIKKNYYTLSVKTPEKALSQSLKTANKFLSEEIKKNNVNWLGNLNFAIISLNNSNLTFSKTGDLKIILIRDGQINDIGKNLNLKDIEPYPLKIFFNVISGKLVKNDVIIVLTKEIFKLFSQENRITKIAATSQREGIQEKTIKEIFPSSLFSKGECSKTSGICLLAVKKEVSKQKILPPGKRGNAKFMGKAGRKTKKISFQKEKRFLLKQNLSSILPLLYKTAGIRPLKIIKKISEFFNRNGKNKKRFSGIHPVRFILQSFNKANPAKFISQLFNKVNLFGKAKSSPLIISKKDLNRKTNPRLEKYRKKAISLDVKKILVLIFVLIFILFLGFLIFRNQGQKGKNTKALLARIQKEINEADNFSIFGDKNKANFLLKRAWQEILPLSEEKNPLKVDVLSLKKSIEKKLKRLNNLETIENPQVARKTAPGLFSSPSSSLVKPPSFKFSFDISSSYLSNLYFLDSKTCQIIKYPALAKSKWGPPQKWIKDNSHCFEPKSMAIDGSVWILNKDNSISRYYIGSYKETINLDIFPTPKDITMIKTAADIPYLYFLEPGEKRIIVTDKKGKIIKQFQSEKFDDLKNIAISKDGKTIYLLNSATVYQIKF